MVKWHPNWKSHPLFLSLTATAVRIFSRLSCRQGSLLNFINSLWLRLVIHNIANEWCFDMIQVWMAYGRYNLRDSNRRKIYKRLHCKYLNWWHYLCMNQRVNSRCINEKYVSIAWVQRSISVYMQRQIYFATAAVQSVNSFQVCSHLFQCPEVWSTGRCSTLYYLGVTRVPVRTWFLAWSNHKWIWEIAT